MLENDPFWICGVNLLILFLINMADKEWKHIEHELIFFDITRSSTLNLMFRFILGILVILYKTYTTGQLWIKTVFQNNNVQDSFHAFLFIFLFRVFIKSSKFNSWGVRNIQKSTWHSRSSFQQIPYSCSNTFFRSYNWRLTLKTICFSIIVSC